MRGALQVCQRGGVGDLLSVSALNHHERVLTSCLHVHTELPIASKLSPDGTQQSEWHYVTVSMAWFS